jgi:3-oxoacyl-[acyl-carrier protein] reductase
MDLGIAGKRAIVAAGSAGLGFATADALVNEGVRVAICGRDAAKLHAAAEQLSPDTIGIVADLASPAGSAEFAREATHALGGCDILIANAGGPPPGTFASTDIDAYQYAFDLDCRSAIAMCQVLIPAMCDQQWGRVVAISSIGAKQPIGGLMASSVARAAITSFLKITAREVAPHGVTVNNLLPGLHTTDRVTGLYSSAAIDDLARSQPTGTLGNPSDFGAMAAFLCSQQASYITGTSTQIDGGSYTGLL